MPLDSDKHIFAKISADPTPAWRLEAGTVAESDATFAAVNLIPQDLAVMTKVSRELLMDSLNIETALPDVMAAAISVELDRVALLGTGTAPEPEGVSNATGIGTAALSAALTTYAPFITARKAIMTANAMPSAIITHPRDENTMAGLTATDNQPLAAPSQVGAIPWFTTTSIPINGGAGTDESTLFMGDWQHMYIGVRHEVQIFVTRDLYAATGQYGFFAHLRADIALVQPAAFHTTTSVTGWSK